MWNGWMRKFDCCCSMWCNHYDVIKWKKLARHWPFVRWIHRSPVNSPHKGQWRGALMFSLICVWINDWANNREAGDLRCYRAHYDVIVMTIKWTFPETVSLNIKAWSISIKSCKHFVTKWWQATTICARNTGRVDLRLNVWVFIDIVCMVYILTVISPSLSSCFLHSEF